MNNKIWMDENDRTIGINCKIQSQNLIVPKPKRNEITKKIKTFKNGKAPGEHMITTGGP